MNLGDLCFNSVHFPYNTDKVKRKRATAALYPARSVICNVERSSVDLVDIAVPCIDISLPVASTKQTYALSAANTVVALRVPI